MIRELVQHTARDLRYEVTVEERRQQIPLYGRCPVREVGHLEGIRVSEAGNTLFLGG